VDEGPGRVALVALSLECCALLEDLGWWAPVGGLRESLLAALAGEEGLSVAEVGRLRSWAARWALVGPGLRALHRAGGTLAAPPEALSRSLWRLLAHPDRVLSPGDRRALRDLSRSLTGSDPAFDIEPVLRDRQKLSF
jgi:hypothetical protein